MLADDCIVHDPMAPGDGFDVDDFIARFEGMQEALTEPEHHIEDIVAEDDYVFFRGWMACTHSGEFMGVAPTNERITGEDHIELRFEDGKIAEAWAQYDTLGLLVQVGVDVPELG